jgi:hypothetical protein
MVNISELKVGDKVHYIPDHYKNALLEEYYDGTTVRKDKWENGIVKEIPEWSIDSVRVVYNCAGDWKNFKNYTSALTNIRDLNLGWKHE